MNIAYSIKFDRWILLYCSMSKYIIHSYDKYKVNKKDIGHGQNALNRRK